MPSISSYAIEPDGNLATISQSVDDFQHTSCWIAGAPDSPYVYTTNTFDSTISGFYVNPDGSLTLVKDDGVSAAYSNPNTFPTDITMTKDGRFLYTTNPGVGTVGIFGIHEDGSLTAGGEVGGLPIFAGAQGIAVR
jgi:6-phosphogluconolactonase